MSKKQSHTISQRRTLRKTNKTNYSRVRYGGPELFSCRVRRTELWATIDTTGNHRITFSDLYFPIWFGQISRLYETYSINAAKLVVKSAYNSLANGLLTLSFNNNPNQGPAPGPEAMLQQQGARQERISKTVEVQLPGYIFRSTPTRRFTVGPQSYLFDADLYVATTDPAQPVSVYLEYDAVFHTPQAPIASAVSTATITRLNNGYNGVGTATYEGAEGVWISPGDTVSLTTSRDPFSITDRRDGGEPYVTLSQIAAGEQYQVTGTQPNGISIATTVRDTVHRGNFETTIPTLDNLLHTITNNDNVRHFISFASTIAGAYSSLAGFF